MAGNQSGSSWQWSVEVCELESSWFEVQIFSIVVSPFGGVSLCFGSARFVFVHIYIILVAYINRDVTICRLLDSDMS